MGNIRFKASKKTLVILFLILFLILGGSGGYLLWRVNQSKTVAPTDSSATTTPPAKRSGAECDVPRCVWPYVAWWLPNTGEGNCACAHRTTSDPNPDLRCDDPTPRCTPPPCPPGYTDMHRPGGGTEFEPRNYSAEDLALIEAANLFHHNVRIVCKENGNDKLCFTECGQERCSPCRNPYWVRRMCKKAPRCGDGNKDPGEICDPGPVGSAPVACKDTNGRDSTCSRDCTCAVAPFCGDGKKDAGEICDPGPVGSAPVACKDTNGRNSTCSRDCTCAVAPFCGDGKKDAGEVCDPGPEGSPPVACKDKNGRDSTCSRSCTCPTVTPPDTTCDPSKAGWINDPKGGKFETCKAPVEYSYKVADPQGVNLGSIVVTLNGQKITPSKVEPNTGTPTVATVSGKLNTTTVCLTPGLTTIKIVWKDKNGNPKGAEKPCTAQTTFTIEAKNTCDAIGAGWKDKVAPPNETVEGKGIVAHYITADKDGVGSIEVLFNNTPLTSVSKVPSADGTKVTITITIPPTKLTVGNHMLQISWKDKLGIGGEKPCKVVHDIVVRERPVPDWDIEKVAKEECIDDGTENPISKITNTITIKNEGNEEGIIQKVVDTLDAKVVGSTVSGITEAGEHTNGKITWSGFRPIPAGGTKVLRYSYTVAKDKFDIYKNSVIATVEGGGTLDAGATIEARCNVVNPSCGDGNLDTALGEQCDPPGSSCTNAYGESNVCTDSCTCPGEPPSIPETGIFDDSRKVVVMGAVLLFTGIGWTWLSSTYKLVNGKLVQRRKENFEQRLVKR